MSVCTRSCALAATLAARSCDRVVSHCAAQCRDFEAQRPVRSPRVDADALSCAASRAFALAASALRASLSARRDERRARGGSRPVRRTVTRAWPLRICRANRAPCCAFRVRAGPRPRGSSRCTPRHETGKTGRRRPGSAWRRSVCSMRLLSASMRRPRTCARASTHAAARGRLWPAARSDGAWQIPACWLRSALARVACTAEASGARSAREMAAVRFLSRAVAVRFQR